jgi:hypothetical protein
MAAQLAVSFLHTPAKNCAIWSLSVIVSRSASVLRWSINIGFACLLMSFALGQHRQYCSQISAQRALKFRFFPCSSVAQCCTRCSCQLLGIRIRFVRLIVYEAVIIIMVRLFCLAHESGVFVDFTTVALMTSLLN